MMLSSFERIEFMANKKNIIVVDELYKKVSRRLSEGKTSAIRSVNATMVATYWLIGYDIVEEEQKGRGRSDYGSYLIEELSRKLKQEYGRGFSVSTVKNIRQFYLIYKEAFSISYAVSSEFEHRAHHAFVLSWTHYRLLMRVDESNKRSFYEKEAIHNRWSSRELERQINSLLFERLVKSRDKKGVMELAQKGQLVQVPEDSIKDPYVLEFLGIPEMDCMTESDLEGALISNLQNFLLELGKGFAFIARQKRLTLDGDHYYADLVFYHTILKCYVIIDLKVGKLTHGDLGQMQLYVNYYDKECIHEGDNPTIGLIICTDKNDSMVKYTLGEQNQRVFASKYQVHLPTEEELKNEIDKEKEKIYEGQNSIEPKRKV